MKKVSTVLWGLVLVAVGAVLAVNALGLARIDLFFDGWWTLFIIVPCTVDLFRSQDKTGDLIGIAVGVVLLLACQDVLSFQLILKLLIPALVIVIGLRLIIGGLFGGKANKLLEQAGQSGHTPQVGCATFSGCDLNYAGQEFHGAELTAVFGGVKCDLRQAIIEKDCAIKATSLFGGVDIFVPEHVNVKVNSTGVFGGTSNKTQPKPNAPTLYIQSTAVFGGVEIK